MTLEYCQWFPRNCTPNEVLSIGTNMFQGFFEPMAYVTTVTAPSTMKIKVVAPPDGKGQTSEWYITEVRSQLFTNSDVGTCQYCTVRLQHPAGNGDRCHYTSHQFGERLLVHVEELRAWTEGLRTILRLALRTHVARRVAWHSLEPQVV